MISEFVEYVKQAWKNKPNVSSPLNADRLNHMEAGIENNSKKIKETVTAVNELTEKMKYTKDVKYESVSIDSDGYGVVEMGIEQNEKIIGANILTWGTGTLYGGPTIGNNGNGYGYIFGKPNSVVTNVSIRWRVIKI